MSNALRIAVVGSGIGIDYIKGFQEFPRMFGVKVLCDFEDCVSMSMEMRDGSLGTISVTLGSLAEIARHRFTFRNVMAESNTEPYANSREPWAFSFKAAGNEQRVRDALEQFKPLPEHYAGQFYRYNQALRDGTELPVTLADARAALELVAATYCSGETNSPVTLPIGPGHPRYEDAIGIAERRREGIRIAPIWNQ